MSATTTLIPVNSPMHSPVHSWIPGSASQENSSSEEIGQSSWFWTAAKVTGFIAATAAFGVFMHQSGVHTAAYHTAQLACDQNGDCIASLYDRAISTMPITNNGLVGFVDQVWESTVGLAQGGMTLVSRGIFIVEVATGLGALAGIVWGGAKAAPFAAPFAERAGAGVVGGVKAGGSFGWSTMKAVGGLFKWAFARRRFPAG